MKKLLSILILFSFQEIHSQCYTFKSFGYYDDRTGYVLPIRKDLDFSKVDDKVYIVLTFPKYMESYSEVHYLFEIENKILETTDSYQGEYCYQGILTKTRTFNCIICTQTALDEFVNGVGSQGGFVYEEKYKIKIWYGNGELDSRNYKYFSIYPVIPWPSSNK